MKKTTLIICVHNHQPVGNLPGVFEEAYRDAYLPFLEAIERFPEIKLVVHNSGPLLEWYEARAPEYVERLARLVERGQVEILTGGFYEPILSGISERDAIAQIRKMTEYVSGAFATSARGMWLAERVWEPRLAGTLARSSVEYVPLDDYEFHLAGVPDEELTGHFVTEDQGHSVCVFPISKKLRYAIPFGEPDATVAHMRALADRGPGLCAVFGDDGEKFGVWPGTHRHVYGSGWLDRFLRALVESREWLRTATFAEFVDAVPARGRVYLPTASYPEMMEWALPTPARRTYARLIAELKSRDAFEAWGPFLAGGSWKGFLAKYDEANLMTRKMHRVSAKVAIMERAVERLRGTDELLEAERSRGTGRDPAVDAAAVARARDELMKGQCNCAYWHGIFGGLYLPHLRAAIYEHLIRAENLLESARGGRWDLVEVVDHDLDGDREVLLESHWANVYVAPARGGTIFELDVRCSETNLLATMARYEEAYHHAPAEPAQPDEKGGGVASIHDAVAAKERGLERLFVWDRHSRRAGVDRFFAPGTSCKDAVSGTAKDLGDFALGRYCFELKREDATVGVEMHRDGTVAGKRVHVQKSVWLTPSGAVRVDYVLGAPDGVDALFAPEWNLAFLTDSMEYSWFKHPGTERASLAVGRSFESSRGGKIADALRKQVVSLECRPAASLHVAPLETASQSEAGLERVFQGVTLVTAWPISLKAGEEAAASVAIGVSAMEAGSDV